MKLCREQVEGLIEYLIMHLDDADGDPDFEPDLLEEQHDAEAELTWNSGMTPDWLIIAERARRKVGPRR